jgi:hypothetical protein
VVLRVSLPLSALRFCCGTCSISPSRRSLGCSTQRSQRSSVGPSSAPRCRRAPATVQARRVQAAGATGAFPRRLRHWQLPPLIDLLAEEAVLYSDGGGVVTTARVSNRSLFSAATRAIRDPRWVHGHASRPGDVPSGARAGQAVEVRDDIRRRTAQEVEGSRWVRWLAQRDRRRPTLRRSGEKDRRAAAVVGIRDFSCPQI